MTNFVSRSRAEQRPRILQGVERSTKCRDKKMCLTSIAIRRQWRAVDAIRIDSRGVCRATPVVVAGWSHPTRNMKARDREATTQTKNSLVELFRGARLMWRQFIVRTMLSKSIGMASAAADC